MTKHPRNIPRLLLKLFLGLVLVLVIAAAAGIFWFRGAVDDSLPALDGERPVAGLGAPVTIERDDLGVPRISAQSRADAVRALGFVHAQERFFAMELARRQAAGELAQLFGLSALRLDRRLRLHRFRSRAAVRLETMPAAHRELLDAYTAGVNAGLAALERPPFEYVILRLDPEPWKPEDTLLTIYSMYLQLQDQNGRYESNLGLVYDLLPTPLADFLVPHGTSWDAPIEGEAFATPPIPGPEVYDLRQQAQTVTTRAPDLRVADTAVVDETVADFARADDALVDADSAAAIGSNNWAVAGAYTTHGGALLANDMHLSLGMPNIWYRASLVYPDADGNERRITGVTLPGIPAIVVGSNGTVAWGFTNTYGDWSDLVIIEPVAGDEDAYRTPTGPEPFQRHQEIVQVKGGGSHELEVVATRWGPILGEDHQGRARALRWVAHDPEGVSLDFFDLETATTLETALATANRTGAPHQNLVVVDRDGRIGWTVLGRIPRRFGHDGRLPSSWADGSRGWDGWLEGEENPQIIDPEGGRIWTANARVVGAEKLALLGDGGYTLGARAGQIRDRLTALETADEAAMLAIQLDDEARFLARWQALLVALLDAEATAENPQRVAFRNAIEGWKGHATVDAVGYRLVNAFRSAMMEKVMTSLTAPCEEADVLFSTFFFFKSEGPLWRLMQERPPHLLAPGYESWEAQMLEAVDSVIVSATAGGKPLAAATWGARNTVHLRHPLSRPPLTRILPLLGLDIDIPPTPLPGGGFMPRIQFPAFGASQRLVVAPGREADGIFHMPGGQSGHPRSPYYRAGHQAWVEGQATPFLPGAAVHTLRLVPPSGS